mmetsp:Transcript_119945/g.340022  ORF Transcript_119945/g.340022 Transcript_119945/m.340022 type:complete len:304 (-) Transcript_119945:626-1537(-)
MRPLRAPSALAACSAVETPTFATPASGRNTHFAPSHSCQPRDMEGDRMSMSAGAATKPERPPPRTFDRSLDREPFHLDSLLHQYKKCWSSVDQYVSWALTWNSGWRRSLYTVFMDARAKPASITTCSGAADVPRQAMPASGRCVQCEPSHSCQPLKDEGNKMSSSKGAPTMPTQLPPWTLCKSFTRVPFHLDSFAHQYKKTSLFVDQKVSLSLTATSGSRRSTYFPFRLDASKPTSVMVWSRARPSSRMALSRPHEAKEFRWSISSALWKSAKASLHSPSSSLAAPRLAITAPLFGADASAAL